jgi:predicted DNA-binding transcriptional regulator YafY
MPWRPAMANPFANSIKFLAAINLLASPHGATIKTLMEHLSISRRTAFRLLEALEELGLPLIDEQSGPRVEKVYRLMDSYVLKLPNMAIPNPGLTGQEIEIITSLLDLCEKIQKLGDKSIFNSIRQKITVLLPEEKDKQRKEQTHD